MPIVIIELRAIAGKEKAVSDLLAEHAARTRVAEEGCLDFQIANKPDSPEIFFLLVTYADAAAQAAHSETEHFRRFSEACEPLLQDAPDGTKFFSYNLLKRVA